MATKSASGYEIRLYANREHCGSASRAGTPLNAGRLSNIHALNRVSSSRLVPIGRGCPLSFLFTHDKSTSLTCLPSSSGRALYAPSSPGCTSYSWAHVSRPCFVLWLRVASLAPWCNIKLDLSCHSNNRDYGAVMNVLERNERCSVWRIACP